MRGGRAGGVLALFRNAALLRVLVTFLLFIVAEYSVWIGMLVYAFGKGGTTAAGIVAVVQLLPGIVAAPLLSTLVDRMSPTRLLVGSLAAQTVGMSLTAVAILLDWPSIVAYAAAVFAATAVGGTRPAQAAVLPGLARSADELAVCNAAQGWLDQVGLVLSGVLTGAALATGEPGVVFVAGAAATAVGMMLLAGIHVSSMAADDADDEPEAAFTAVARGVRLLRDQPAPRLLVGLITAEYVVIGALDVLFVVLAISVLHQGAEWSGYLNTACGLGGVAAGAVAIALLGRRLAGPIVVAATVLCLGLALTALSHTVALTLVLVAAVGLGQAVLDIATRTLLQRTAPTDRLGLIFGLVEGLSAAGLAAGSLLVPALNWVGGTSAAVIGTAAVVPAVALVGGRALGQLDSAAQVPVVEIALLRSMPHFRALPVPELEGLARAATRRECGDGETILRQGDPGDDFYAIAEGDVAIFIDGVLIATRTRPEGLGEIALLRSVPRTATAVADGPVVLYKLSGDDFLAVVTGHEATRARSEEVAERRLSGDDPALA